MLHSGNIVMDPAHKEAVVKYNEHMENIDIKYQNYVKTAAKYHFQLKAIIHVCKTKISLMFSNLQLTEIFNKYRILKVTC